MSHRLRWQFPGGIPDSKLASLGRALLPWLGVSANEAVTRNLSTLEDIAESAAKVTAAQQKSLDSLNEVVMIIKYPWLSFSWARRCLCYGQHHLLHSDWHFWGVWDIRSLHKITEKTRWLKKVTSSMGVFLWLTWFWLVWVLGTMALKCSPDIGNSCPLFVGEIFQDPSGCLKLWQVPYIQYFFPCNTYLW